MRVTIWKSDKESNERAITRFNKKVQGSRKMLELRSKKYHKKQPTKRYTREAAVMRDYYRSKKERSRFY